MDLSNFTVNDLESLSAKVQNEIEKRQQDEVKKARDRIFTIAQNVGVPISDLLNVKGNKEKKSAKVVDVKYRHPEDANKIWTGRGRKPGWIVDFEQSGKIDSARV